MIFLSLTTTLLYGLKEKNIALTYQFQYITLNTGFIQLFIRFYITPVGTAMKDYYLIEKQ